MHVYYKFGLFLIFILSVSTCYTRAAPGANKNSTANDDYPDDYDDYYDELEGGASYSSTAANRQAAAIATTTTHKPLFSFLELPKRSNHVLEPNCPKACLCMEDYKHIQCSNARLTHVPGDIPSTALIIDLSQNQIGELHAADFANCSKVREINLSHNELKEINREAFEGLSRLKRLYLANNHLRHIEPYAFAGASDLDILDLSDNAIVLRDQGSFLNQPNLLEFSCRNCSWTTLYDDTFANLSQLTALKLDQNDFNKQINTKAFTPLRNLIKLKLPELDQTSVQELCNLLKAIDNISFRHFDVSCFELVLGATYNESLIFATDPPYKPAGLDNTPTDDDSSASEADTKQQQQAERDGSNGSADMTQNSSEVNSNLTQAGGHEPSILTAGVVATAAAPPMSADDKGEQTYQVPISQEVINFLLIGIMVIAVVGIIIGVICRKDVGGIKTKCCRTRKPEAKDQVHPAEEIPLNKLA